MQRPALVPMMGRHEPETATVPADGQPLETITHRERSDGISVSSLRELQAAGFTVLEEMRRPEWTEEMYETMDCSVEVAGKVERAGVSYWAIGYHYGDEFSI